MKPDSEYRGFGTLSQSHNRQWLAVRQCLEHRCIRRLAAYKPPPPPNGVVYPLSRSAAVLVALFVGRTGELYVMLNRYVPDSNYYYILTLTLISIDGRTL